MIGLKTNEAARELYGFIRGFIDDCGLSLTLGCVATEAALSKLRDETMQAIAQRVEEQQAEIEMLKNEGKEEPNEQGESTGDIEEDRDDDGSDVGDHER